jgi:hypothetical protein
MRAGPASTHIVRAKIAICRAWIGVGRMSTRAPAANVISTSFTVVGARISSVGVDTSAGNTGVVSALLVVVAISRLSCNGAFWSTTGTSISSAAAVTPRTAGPTATRATVVLTAVATLIVLSPVASVICRTTTAIVCRTTTAIVRSATATAITPTGRPCRVARNAGVHVVGARDQYVQTTRPVVRVAQVFPGLGGGARADEPEDQQRSKRRFLHDSFV